MTLRAWLRERSPAPPDRLLARIDARLGDRAESDVSEIPSACIAAAEELLAELLSGDPTGRESALDLLTVDALVTYAFEAASAAPENVPALATDSMARLAAVTQS